MKCLWLLIAAGLILQGCKPDQDPLGYTGGNNSGGGDTAATTSRYGPFPVPGFDVSGGVLGTALISTGAGGVFANVRVGFGGVYKHAATNSFVYGGAYTIDSTTVDTILTSSGPIYLLPNQHKPTAGVPVPFDGHTVSTFSLEGNSSQSIAAVADTMTTQAVSHITYPDGLKALARDASLPVQWDGTGDGTSVMLLATDHSGHGANLLGLDNNGSATIPDTSLSHFAAGAGTLMLVKVRYHIVVAGDNAFAIVAETIHSLPVSWK